MDETKNPTERFPLDTERLWDLVCQQVDHLSAAWEHAQQPPDLGIYVAGLPPVVQRTALIELIKLDMEQRWARGCAPWRVEDYATEFPELFDQSAPVDLIYEEYQIRRQHGDNITPSELARRFPRQSAELLRLLDTDAPMLRTSLRPAKVIEQIQAGQQIDDFDLLQRIGQGAFATVFLAHQRSMQRLVAVKISSESSHEPQTLARLDHPHIVRVYDQRVLTDRSLRLLYMQYVAGGTLQDAIRALQCHAPATWSGKQLCEAVDEVLARRGIQPPADAEQRQRLAELDWCGTVCLLGAQIADALDYAHREGVLHRDLKPANILLNEAVRPQLVDFNVSSCSKIDGASPAAYFGGSLAYMSPEQLQACNPRHDRTAETLDGRSDIYALGIVLWELLTGVRPFLDRQLPEGWPATVEAMTERRLEGLTPTQYQQLPHKCPSGLRNILEQCLLPDRDQRFATAAEVAAQLRRCLHPEAERIFAPPTKWRAFAAQWPVLSMVLMLLIPNALAARFNYDYNYRAIIMKHPAAEPIFEQVQMIINATAFPLGVIIGVYLVWRVAKEVAWRHRHRAAAPAPARLRHHCLQLGHHLSLLSLTLWIVAGFAYPVALRVAQSPLTLIDYIHFFGSLALCGLIVAAYPFFGAFSIIVESWYPLLCGNRAVSRDDVPKLAWLQTVSWRYLLTAVLVPMLSTTILVLMNDQNTRVPLIVLSFSGLLCFVLVFTLARRLHADLAVLQEDAT